MYPYRVVVSYSHNDLGKAQQVVKSLKRIGARPLWDPQVEPGTHFSDAIKEMISFAHVCLPLLTESSIARPWDHRPGDSVSGAGVVDGFPIR